MERIGIAPQGNIIPTGNGADFRRVSRHERVCRIFLNGGKANEHFLTKCVHPPTKCQETASEYREGGMTSVMPPASVRGLSRGLSRVRGNSHARFLGERVAVMPLPYPTA
jgi:hypothetical protein